MAIFGLELQVMNQLSTVGTQIDKINDNGLSVRVGDDETGMSLVFVGNIYSAYVEGNAQPNVAFVVAAKPGVYAAVEPAEPLSIKGSADAADMIAGLAKKMGLSFENNGVSVKLSNPYYGGTLMTQAMKIARHGGFDIIFDRGILAIIAPDKSRDAGTPLVSPKTGMIGYPSFNQAQVVVRSLFNPQIIPYSNIRIESEITPACGTWRVIGIQYDLEAETPGGRWEQEMTCVTTGDNIAGT